MERERGAWYSSGVSESDDGARSWEIKCLPYPYSTWARQTFEDEAEAQQMFRELWLADPPAVNLSMRSYRLDGDDERT